MVVEDVNVNGLTTVTDDAKTIISTCVTMVAGVTVTMFVIIVAAVGTRVETAHTILMDYAKTRR